MFTITSISTGLTSLFFLLSGLRLYFSWRKKKTFLLKSFAIFLIFFGFQQLFFSLGTGLVSMNPTVNIWLWAMAHVFMFIGISFFLRFPFYIRFPRFEKLAFRIAILYSIIGASILFYNMSKVEAFLFDNGVYIFKVPAIAGLTIGTFTTICLLFSFFIFFDEGRKVRDKRFRIRSFLIALGILVFFIAGPAHNFVTTPLLTFIVDFSLIVSALLIIIGVYVPVGTPSPSADEKEYVSAPIPGPRIKW